MPANEHWWAVNPLAEEPSPALTLAPRSATRARPPITRWIKLGYGMAGLMAVEVLDIIVLNVHPG